MKLSRKLAAIFMAVPLALTATTAISEATEYVDLDDGCFKVQVQSPTKIKGDGYVASGIVGYFTTNNETNAEPIAFEATYTGRYRLLDQKGRPLYASIFDEVWAGSYYGSQADWTITPAGNGNFKIVNTHNKKPLSSRLNKLATGNTSRYHNTTFKLVPTQGCFEVPHGDPGVISGPTEPAINANGTINGIMDGHGHTLSAFSFGGKIFCGKPFSPGGIDDALAPCQTHKTGAGTFFEMLLSGTKMYEDTKMWPTFENRPRYNTLLTQTGYYTGIERAFNAGVRGMNIILVGNRVICSIFPAKGDSCNEMDQVRAQYEQVANMIDHIDAQSGGPGKGFMQLARTPQEMRDLIAKGKMAITLGLEVSEPFGCDGITGCTTADIDRGLDEMESYGVSNIFLVHKFDNALGGVRFDAGDTGTIMTFGNVISKGHFFTVEKCEGPEADIPMKLTADKALELYKKWFGKDYTGKLPIYPSGQVCNRIGLSDLGAYAVNQMMDRGLMINVDHMSVKTIKDTLNITKAAGYPGIMSNHTWSDPLFYEDVVSAGGFYGSYLFSTDEMVQRWKDDHAVTPSLDHYGIGPDITGMGALPAPRKDAATNPLKYPFTAPSGAVMSNEVWGQKAWDINNDGMSTYGLVADWLADFLYVAGPDAPQIKKELMNSAEAWVKTWEGSQKWAAENQK